MKNEEIRIENVAERFPRPSLIHMILFVVSFFIAFGIEEFVATSGIDPGGVATDWKFQWIISAAYHGISLGLVFCLIHAKLKMRDHFRWQPGYLILPFVVIFLFGRILLTLLGAGETVDLSTNPVWVLIFLGMMLANMVWLFSCMFFDGIRLFWIGYYLVQLLFLLCVSIGVIAAAISPLQTSGCLSAYYSVMQFVTPTWILFSLLLLVGAIVFDRLKNISRDWAHWLCVVGLMGFDIFYQIGQYIYFHFF